MKIEKVGNFSILSFPVNFGVLKKLVALFIVSLYLISSTELREVLKFPVLFQHFYEHKEIDPDITFTGFLLSHYNSVPHTDNDEERDMQLPFKTLGGTILSTPAIPLNYRTCFQKPVKLIILNNASLYKENYIPTPEAGKIWQPPKA